MNGQIEQMTSDFLSRLERARPQPAREVEEATLSGLKPLRAVKA